MLGLPTSSRGRYGLRDILGGFETQMRVLNALILRETKTRYGEHRVGFLWALLEPVAMVVVFVGIFSAVRGASAGAMPIVPFMLTGLVCFGFYRDTMGQLQGALSSNTSLLSFPQVTTFDVIFARAVLEVATTMAVFVILLICTYLIGFEYRIERPLGVLAVVLLLSGMGVGIGFVLTCLRPLIPSVQQLSSAVLGRPLFLSSGIFFTAEAIPAFARDFLLYNPLLHMMELLRSEFFFEYETAYGSWRYATMWSLCVMALGLLVHQALKRRAVVGL